MGYDRPGCAKQSSSAQLIQPLQFNGNSSTLKYSVTTETDYFTLKKHILKFSPKITSYNYAKNKKKLQSHILN